MVRGFHVGSEDDASFYAGILISAFSLCEAISGMFWGSVSDRIGRKPVLLMGCCGTVLSLLIVGFSQSFTVALLGRALGGLLNGNIGVIQTMVAELVKNPKHEPKAYAIMPFVWAVGTIIGPAVGGLFANPVKSFPTVFSKKGIFAKYPWALPNIICAAIMILSIVLSYFCLEETHPDLCANDNTQFEPESTENTPVFTATNSGTDPSFDLRRGSYGTFNDIEVPIREQWSVRPTGSSRSSISERQVNKWFTWRIAMLLTALGIYTCKSQRTRVHNHSKTLFIDIELITSPSQIMQCATNISSPFSYKTLATKRSTFLRKIPCSTSKVDLDSKLRLLD